MRHRLYRYGFDESCSYDEDTIEYVTLIGSSLGGTKPLSSTYSSVPAWLYEPQSRFLNGCNKRDDMGEHYRSYSGGIRTRSLDYCSYVGFRKKAWAYVGVSISG